MGVELIFGRGDGVNVKGKDVSFSTFFHSLIYCFSLHSFQWFSVQVLSSLEFESSYLFVVEVEHFFSG